MASSAAAVERHDMSTVPDLSLRIEASTNVTTPTPAELVSLRQMRGVITKACDHSGIGLPYCEVCDTAFAAALPSPYRPEGEAWTPVDEHDGEGSP